MNSYKLDDEGRKMVEDNMKLVPFTLAKYFGENTARDEDLVSIGNLALCQAAATFDPDRGIKFSSYAIKCIMNAIRTDGRKKYAAVKATGSDVISLNQKASFDEEGAEEIMDLVPDKRVNVEDEVLGGMFCEIVKPLVPTFTEMMETGLEVRDLAHREKKTRQGIHSRMQREFRRAQTVLIHSGYV